MAAFAVDSLSYAGYNFDNLVSSRVRAQNVYDDANRMVKYVDFTLDVKGYMGATMPAQTTDATMASLKTTLMTPGKILKYNNRGYGPVVINDPAVGVYDVAWGPQPHYLNFTPLGMGYGCIYEWRVSFKIPTCRGSVYQNALTMVCYDVTLDIDEQGLTIYTVSGAIEIPLTFRNGDNLVDNVDAYKERCFPLVPPGFVRLGPKHWKISADRKRGEFGYTDKQIPIALPNHTTFCEVKHRVRNVKKMAWLLWAGEISGTIRTSPSVGKVTALDRFLTIVLSRLRHTAALVAAPGGAAAAAAGVDPVLLARGQLRVNHLDMTENVFGLDNSFSLSYEFNLTHGLTEIVNASGLWRPITEFNFADYNASLANTVNHARGVLRARYQNSQDTIIDLCSPQPSLIPTRPLLTSTANLQVAGTYEVADPETMRDVSDPSAAALAPNEANSPTAASLGQPMFSSLPPPELSWLSYQSFLAYDEDDNIAIHKPLTGTVSQQPDTVDAMNFKQVTDQDDTSIKTWLSASAPDIVQRISSPSIRVMLFGSAQRIGYAADPPELLAFAGQAVQQLRRRVVNGTTGECNGVPVYQVMWQILYAVLTPPTTLPVLANPMYPLTGGSPGSAGS